MLLTETADGRQAGAVQGIIEARLQEFPKLSAPRLFDEIRGTAYAGGYGRVRDYVRAARPQERC